MGEKQSQFEELLLTHLDDAFNVAFWLTQNDRDAQVIIEKACEQAWEEFGRRREGDVRTWLLAIVMRIAHALREEKSYQSKVVPFFPSDGGIVNFEPTADMPVSAEFQAVHEEAGQSIYRALSRLPVELREILVLHELEGCTYQQLASALRISEDAVAARLGSARRRLRNEIRAGKVKGDW
jgi:RNA polymerase sigma-70 factor (ECF subfamily)